MIYVQVFKYSLGHALKGTIVVICVNSPLHITVIFLYSACSPQIQRQIIAIVNSELWCSLKAFIVERIDAVLYVLFTFHITVAVLFAPKVLCNTGKGKLFFIYSELWQISQAAFNHRELLLLIYYDKSVYITVAVLSGCLGNSQQFVTAVRGQGKEEMYLYLFKCAHKTVQK